MIIGCLELPNKWAMESKIRNQHFIYNNEENYFQNCCELWGGVIRVAPWFRNFKIISQFDTRIAEYWCVMLDNGQTSGILVPIAVKRYGYRNKNSKCFLFKHGIQNLLAVANMGLANHNTAYDFKQSAGEFLFDIITDNAEQYPVLNKQWSEIAWHNKDKILLPSGTQLPIRELLARCSMVDHYAKHFVCQLNEMISPSDIGINSAYDLLQCILDFLPISLDEPGYVSNRSILPENLLEFSKVPSIEVDWIGDCILGKDLTQFNIDDVRSSIVRTPDTLNTIKILSDVSKQEELVNPIEMAHHTIAESPGLSSIDQSAVMEAVDDIITSICIDEATTFDFVYDLASHKMQYLSRIYGYGESSRDYYRGSVKEQNPIDVCEFALQCICEALDAISIRCIKTFNEELFIECTFGNGSKKTFYINILVHLCVSGTLFNA